MADTSIPDTLNGAHDHGVIESQSQVGTPRSDTPAGPLPWTPSQFVDVPDTPYDRVVNFSTARSALNGEHPNEDFVLFQTIHLMTELCWYTVHYELDRAAGRLVAGDHRDSARLIRRAARMQEVANVHVAALQDELPQDRFLRLRELLPEGGSGLDSPGMRNLQDAARRLWRTVEDSLSRDGVTLLDVLRSPHPPLTEDLSTGLQTATSSGAGLREVALSCQKLDETVIAWQQAHQRIVWGRLGGHPVARRSQRASDNRAGLPRSLTGRPVDMLDGFARRALFPQLWRAVDEVYAGTEPSQAGESPTSGLV